MNYFNSICTGIILSQAFWYVDHYNRDYCKWFLLYYHYDVTAIETVNIIQKCSIRVASLGVFLDFFSRCFVRISATESISSPPSHRGLKKQLLNQHEYVLAWAGCYRCGLLALTGSLSDQSQDNHRTWKCRCYRTPTRWPRCPQLEIWLIKATVLLPSTLSYRRPHYCFWRLKADFIDPGNTWWLKYEKR